MLFHEKSRGIVQPLNEFLFPQDQKDSWFALKVVTECCISNLVSPIEFKNLLNTQS